MTTHIDPLQMKRFADAIGGLRVAFVPMTLAFQNAAYSVKKMCRPLDRLGWTKGDYHIERVCKEILTGVPGRSPEVRLSAAAGFAEVLDS